MKRIITLFAFAFTIMIGANEVQAQNKLEINAIASEKAKELKKHLKFDKNTLEEVYQAFREYEMSYSSISANLDEKKEEKKELDMKLEAKMKDILSPENYDRYLKIKLEQNAH